MREWSIELSKDARRQMHKLDRRIQIQVSTLIETLESGIDPYSFGATLTGNLQGYWRYRLNDYRVICEILEPQGTIRIVRIAHRSTVYKRF